MAAEEWRIDELAQRCGSSVDTVRFYQREGLLPPARRLGRSLLFGPAHLSRIQQIQDLQTRHFSLSAVKELLDEDRLGVIQAVFARGEADLSREDLMTRSGLDPAAVDRLIELGILADPASTGRTAYDQADLQLLHTVGGLVEAGVPLPVVIDLVGVYADEFALMKARARQLFTDGDRWPAGGWEQFQRLLGERLGDILRLTEQLLTYMHHRTVQSMAVGSLGLAGDTAEGGAEQEPASAQG